MKEIIKLAALTLTFFLHACAPDVVEAPEPRPSTVEFFENLAAHCGSAYRGETVYPTDETDPMVGAVLLMHVRDCSPDQLQIPFLVGEDSSRTWMLTLDGDDLILKHDHRRPDGAPDDLTNYGGRADSTGTPWQQSFPADAFTKELLPEAATNVWTLQIDLEAQQFVYDLQRHGQPRYRAEFDLTQPVPPKE